MDRILSELGVLHASSISVPHDIAIAHNFNSLLNLIFDYHINSSLLKLSLLLLTLLDPGYASSGLGKFHGRTMFAMEGKSVVVSIKGFWTHYLISTYIAIYLLEN